MTTGEQGSAPTPGLPAPRPRVAVPVEPGNSFYERLAAPLPGHLTDASHFETVAEREARRLKARLPEGYIPSSAADLTFDPRIAYELALAVSSPAVIFQKYGLDLDQAKVLIANPWFIQTIKRYKEEVTATGVSFKLKAKIQAEDLLTHSYILATDPEVPPAVRADLIKWTAKVAGLEPDSKDKGGGAAGGGFQLNITFAGAAPQVQGRTLDVAHQVLEVTRE